MGCAQTRDQSLEKEIEDYEELLQFSNHTISQINQAFFHTSGSSVVNPAQMNRVLEELNIQHSVESEYHWKNFASAFVSFEEEGENYYDLTELLIALYLLSKSSLKEKASALFELYNEEAKDELSKMEIERILNHTIEVVFAYSERLMDNDEGLTQIHSKLAMKKKEEVLPKVYAFFFTGKESFNRVDFIKLLEQASKKEELVDFTNPSSIRKTIMNFVTLPKKTQVELQYCEVGGRLSRHEHAFEDEMDARTSTDSPTATSRSTGVVGVKHTPKHTPRHTPRAEASKSVFVLN